MILHTRAQLILINMPLNVISIKNNACNTKHSQIISKIFKIFLSFNRSTDMFKQLSQYSIPQLYWL